jgi:hypothetical protein
VTAEATVRTAPARLPIDHRAARERWGEPDEWVGSVNDPRTREEQGIRFNEKWIYYLPHDEQRWVYWHRYGCRGVLRRARDGSLGPEPL